MKKCSYLALAASLLLAPHGTHGAPDRPSGAPSADASTASCTPPWETFVPAKRDQGEIARKPPPDMPTPPPRAWSAADRRKLEALQSVCATAYYRETNDERVWMGCRSCELRPSKAPPVAVASTWKEMPRTLTDVRWGGFTRKGADEGVLTLSGCERTVESMGMITKAGQGLALVEHRGRHWEHRRYVPEIGYCAPIRRRDGREAFLCSVPGLDGHDGVDLIDWTSPELPVKVLDLTTRPLAEEACEHPHHAEVATLEGGYSLVDLNDDGVDDIKFHAKVYPFSMDAVRAERARPDFALACACHRVLPRSAHFYPESARVRVKKGCACPALFAKTHKPEPAQEIELRFIETEGRFEPTPETKAALDGLRRWHLWPPSVPGDTDD